MLKLPYFPEDAFELLELGWRHGREVVDLKNYQINDRLLRTCPKDLIVRYKFVPLEQDDDLLTIAVSDPGRNFEKIDEIGLETGKRIYFKVALASQIQEVLQRTSIQ